MNDKHQPARSGGRPRVRAQAVPNSHATASPGLAKFRDKMYVAYQDTGGLWYSTLDLKKTFNDVSPPRWSDPVHVPNVGISGAPALAVLNDKLYVAHQGSNNSGELWYSAYDENVWSNDTWIKGVTMSESPALAMYKRLYLAHQGSGQAAGTLWYAASSDGVNWSPDALVPNVRMSGSPSLAVFNGTLYWAHQGGSNNGEVWYSAFLWNASISRWFPDAKIPNLKISASPGLGAYTPDPGNAAQPKLVVFHRSGDDTGDLCYTVSSDPARGNWEDDENIGGPSLSDSPAVAVVDGFSYTGKGSMRVFCAYRGSASNKILVHQIIFE